jgi:hypothetical protein
VRRYNPSDAYVDLVLSVMQTYASGDVVPVVAAGVAVPATGTTAPLGAWDHGATVSSVGQHVRDGDGKESGGAKSTGTAGPPASPDVPTTPQDGPDGPRLDDPLPAPPAPLANVLTRAEAVLRCTLTGLSQLLQPERFQNCVEREMG